MILRFADETVNWGRFSHSVAPSSSPKIDNVVLYRNPSLHEGENPGQVMSVEVVPESSFGGTRHEEK